MSDDKLERYKKKRDFEGTPEPAGEVTETAAHRFVVQKHAARRLHYDLRLEMEGVLRSWAIPRGPSLDPEEKRLAVNTEDHPLEYLEFEGVIPEGHYGAGNMIVWDRGTYECRGAETDPVKAWHKGTIDLRLHGEKLKGYWLLVKLKGKDEADNWLFFKKPDQYADSGRDITEELPESVLSGLDVSELVEGEQVRWASRVERLLEELQIEPSPIEETVAPMLATLVTRVPSGSGWLFELKYDGIRALAEKKTAISGSTPAISSL